MTDFAWLRWYTRFMEIIYIDSMFILNAVIDYFILLATGRICALPLRRGRFALSAAFGGVYAVFAVIPGFEFITLVPFKLCSAAAMILIAFGADGKFLKHVIMFIVVSAAFGGAVFAASMLGGYSLPGDAHISISMRVLVLSFALCYAALTVLFRRAARRAELSFSEVQVEYSGREVRLTALNDTGNSLHDPVSGCGVMVTDILLASELFPNVPKPVFSDATASSAMQLLAEEYGLRGVFRLIPYSAVGVSSLLLAFRPGRITIDGDERSDVLVAISPTVLSSDGSYSAII